MRQHFFSTVRALHGYVLQQMPEAGLRTPCIAISAREGVFEKGFNSSIIEEIASDGINDWLLFARTSHDSTGWDEVLPNYKHVIVDGNHFTMMRQPLVGYSFFSPGEDINEVPGNASCRLHSRRNTSFYLV
jgi:thioesterase domain-containing protein